MPYAGFAAAQAHKSKSSSAVEGFAGKNDNDDEGDPFWDRDTVPASSVTMEARARSHLTDHRLKGRPSFNDIIDLTLDDGEKCARPWEPNLIDLTAAAPTPSRLLVQQIMDETGTELGLAVAGCSEDDDVVFVERVPPALASNNAVKATVRAECAHMQTKRLPDPQQGVLELRHARSPIRMARIAAKQEGENPWNDPKEEWFLYPNDVDGDEIYINATGEYAYNKTKGIYLSIQRKEYANGFVKMRVSIYVGGKQKRKTMDFGRVYLQSFIGRRLQVWETCDHRNQDREDSSYDNLFPRHRLFQGYNKKIHREAKDHLDRSEVGVYKAGNLWVATVRAYTPDGPTLSKEILRSFSTKEQAVVFRKRYTLQKGMCFDCPERVAPTIFNRKRVQSNGETDVNKQTSANCQQRKRASFAQSQT